MNQPGLARHSRSVCWVVLCTLCLWLTACGGGSSTASAGKQVAVQSSVAGSNVAEVVIDKGPAGAKSVINAPYVSVTLCQPGTQNCQTIDHVLLDTGSYGLRIMEPGVLNASLALPNITGPGGKPVAECAQFFSGFFWGSVRSADVRIASEVATSIAVQQVSDTGASFATIPSACSSTGANIGSVAALGAKGILGVGLFKQDCGAACATQAIAGTYYECSATSCLSTTMPLAQQVSNPVAQFSSTNTNGIAVVMPAVPPGGASSVTGSLVFGIDTQTNNQVNSATVYATNSAGNFTTEYNNKSYSSSFLDSGSNGLFFSDASFPACSTATGFYCPVATQSLSALNRSTVNNTSGTVNFNVENIELLDSNVVAAATGGSLGRGTRSRTFVWGMPFFYGRTVFVAIDGASTQHGTGPYWAY